jgi:NADP-dependent 3-hydroxy acid dehydrogenase YdfG
MTKHVMINGCTRGLGLEVANSFAARGWQVSGRGIRQDAVERLAAELGKSGNAHLIRTCDVTSAKNVAARLKSRG